MRVKLLILTLLLLFFGAGSVFASDILINEVYYDVDSNHGKEPDNEWIELYNTTDTDINLEGWKLIDNFSTDTFPSLIIKKKSTFLIAAKSSTWSFWTISGDKFALEASLGNGLKDEGDQLVLKDSNGVEHDKLSYGNNTIYPPGLPNVNTGHSLERIPAGGNFTDQNTPTPGAISQTIINSPTPSPTPTPAPSSTSPASSFTIANIPSQINSDQSFNVSVDLTLPNNKNTDYYLSGAFKKVGNTRYFGLTKISSGWVKYDGNNYLNQYKITTNDGGNWPGILEVKLDTADSDYKGAGDYIFKVARYSSGSNPTWSNEITIKISDVSNNNQGNVTTETPPPSITPTPYQSYSKNQVVYRIASVAAAVASATPSAKVEIKNQKQTNPLFWAGVILIFAGVCLLGYIYLKRDGKIFNLFRRRN